MVLTNDLNRKLVLSPEVMFQELGGEMVLLDLASESYFGLDEVGARIWALLKEHGELQTVFEAMLAEYNVGPRELEKDLLELVERLLEAGLVREGQFFPSPQPLFRGARGERFPRSNDSRRTGGLRDSSGVWH